MAATAELKLIAQLLQLHRLPQPSTRAKVLLHTQHSAKEGTQQLQAGAMQPRDLSKPAENLAQWMQYSKMLFICSFMLIDQNINKNLFKAPLASEIIWE